MAAENPDKEMTGVRTDAETLAEDGQVITPWKVESAAAINYMKLINKFGCEPIDGELIKRFEKVTKVQQSEQW